MLRSLKGFVRRVLRPALHKPDVCAPFHFFGTEYGGWPLLKSTPEGSLIYSFGIGEDISFDLESIERLKCIVHGFDPTPKSLAWIASQKLPSEFHFHRFGIADRDGEAEFFAPATDGHVSFSAYPSRSLKVSRSVKAEVMRLSSIVETIGGREPDILKIDIEGFEYDVIADILAGTIRPQQLLVEFHHGMYGIAASRTQAAVDQLRSAGYKIFFVSSTGREYGLALGM